MAGFCLRLSPLTLSVPLDTPFTTVWFAPTGFDFKEFCNPGLGRHLHLTSHEFVKIHESIYLYAVRVTLEFRDSRT